ncbi:transporter [Streptomyces hydrogenans]|uniref:sodium:solute symporter family transporter n=1 Tax=Streptomyces hydrogenans TaxID=1873719 RepID=UPI0035E3AB1A
MTADLLSTSLIEPLSADVRRPVIIAFLVFIGCALLWLITLVSDQADSPDELYVAGRALGPGANGFALAGELITASTLLAVPGAVALFGYDGFAVAIDLLLGLGIALLFAQKMRNSGCYTLGDLFGLRAAGTAPRIAGAVITLAITLPLLLLQFRAAGVGASLLIGASTLPVQVTCTVMIGCLVTCFAAMTELRSGTYIQLLKVPLVLLTLGTLTLLSLKAVGWHPDNLLTTAANGSANPTQYFAPGMWPYENNFGPLNDIGAHMVVILGTACAPHMILRISASRTGQAARRSAAIAIALTGIFSTLLITTGFAASAVVGGQKIFAVDGNGQSSLLLLAAAVVDEGPTLRVVLLTVISCVTFLAVLTAVSSATFAAAVSLAHDVFARHKRHHTDEGEVRFLRWAVVVLCAAGILLSAVTYTYQVEFLITFAMSVAATCVFPTLTLTFLWPRFNRRGLLWSVYGGLLICTTLMLFSPSVSGNAYALWPHAAFDWYPLQTPGLLSMPAALALGGIGSLTSRSEQSQKHFSDLESTFLVGRTTRHKESNHVHH